MALQYRVDWISRRVELEIIRGMEHPKYLTRIIDIDGTTIKLQSPMDGLRPIEIKVGTPLIIHEENRGGVLRSYEGLWAGLTDHPELPHLYEEEIEEGEEGNWILLVQQPDDQPIQCRELFRVDVRVPVYQLELADSGKTYGDEENPLYSINLSANGMLLSIDLDDKSEIPIGTKVILYFQLTEFSYELPPIKGTVIRIYKARARQYHVGIAFDAFAKVDIAAKIRKEEQERFQNKEDLRAIIRFVKREDIKKQAWLHSSSH